MISSGHTDRNTQEAAGDTRVPVGTDSTGVEPQTAEPSSPLIKINSNLICAPVT